jgi:hypothetical protein
MPFYSEAIFQWGILLGFVAVSYLSIVATSIIFDRTKETPGSLVEKNPKNSDS